jgi:hypothetical protein
MFPNLAFLCEKKIFSDDYLLIPNEDILFKEYNRYFYLFTIEIIPQFLFKQTQIECRH